MRLPALPLRVHGHGHRKPERTQVRCDAGERTGKRRRHRLALDMRRKERTLEES